MNPPPRARVAAGARGNPNGERKGRRVRAKMFHGCDPNASLKRAVALQILNGLKRVIIYYANHASESWLSARKAFLRLGLFQCLARFEVFRLSAVDLGLGHGYDLLRKVAEAIKFCRFFAHDLLVPRYVAGVNLGDARRNRKDEPRGNDQSIYLLKFFWKTTTYLRNLWNGKLGSERARHKSGALRDTISGGSISTDYDFLHQLQTDKICWSHAHPWPYVPTYSDAFLSRANFGTAGKGDIKWLIYLQITQVILRRPALLLRAALTQTRLPAWCVPSMPKGI